MASLDVSSFYEHVDVQVLAEDLGVMVRNQTAVDRVAGFLNTFQNINHAWGLPQGSDASGILANAYLASVDQYLSRHGFPFFRYSDDIIIFDEDWNSLRDVLVDVNRIFRSRKLTMAGHKTSIVEYSEAVRRLENAREASIDHGVRVGDPQAAADIRKYFDEACGEDPIDTRRLKYALTKMRKRSDGYAVAWCVDNIRYIAHAAKEVFAYLAVCGDQVPGARKKLAKFLTSRESASYPYVEQRILRHFLRLDVCSEDVKEAAWGILEDRNREEFPREFAARYFGRHASAAESQLIRHKFEEEPSFAMRRALMIALYESGYLSDRYRCAVEGSFRELRWLCCYLGKNPKIPTA
ncbi:RNA-directed DNA polymerase [Streptomyces virginiae]|uniref:RNA-directed DNA polymerase n=1 Tax=Streptomyces virginiae TaxID=1961 RepID=UPI0036A43DD4